MHGKAVATDFPLVSIIIPCRNEELFIAMCLDSIMANVYPKDRLEVLIVDGMSEDRTRAIVEGYARRHACIRLIDNPKRITPAALNEGIKHAKGEIVMRMDAHATYDREYIPRCVTALDVNGADNVGGIMIAVPRQETLTGHAIVASLTHRFGVGNSCFRIGANEPRRVDTVFGGCYRKEIFARVGLFNEDLAKSQDIEFNLRLKKAGGKTLLLPEVVSYYFARSDMSSFLKHNWNNGVWAVLPFAYSDIIPVSWRHLVPLAFVTSLLGSAVLGLLMPSFLWLCVAVVVAYGIADLAASLHLAVRERDVRYVLLMPAIFASLHLTYGLGSLWGVVKVVTRTVLRQVGHDKRGVAAY